MSELNISHSDASAAILAHVDAGTLVQGKWHDRRASDGREIACLLGAIHPSVESPADCNGELMPMWLAEMTPTLFDGIPAESVLPVARRYGELVARWGKLSQDQWDAILTRVLVRCIDVAMESARPVNEERSYWPAVAAACDQVKTALVSGGDAASFEAAAWAAWAARAAEAAARAAAARAARAAKAAAAWAARAAEAAAAEAAACLSLFGFVLDQIEMECGQ